jgi:hypothetical protein
MFKSFVAVIVSLLAWFAAATVANALLRAALPGYASVERAMDFSLTMLFARLAVGVFASLAAGLACAAVVGAGYRAVWVAGGILVALFIPVHYGLWAKFPLWYHAFFLLSLAPTVWLGARGLGSRRTA